MRKDPDSRRDNGLLERGEWFVGRPLEGQSAKSLTLRTDSVRFSHARDFTDLLGPAMCPEPTPQGGFIVEPRADPTPPRTDLEALPGAAEGFVRECARRLIAYDYDQASFNLWVERCADVRVVDLMLSVMTLAARYLGDMWLEDLCSFSDVTIAMHRLTLLLIALEPPHGDPSARAQHGGRVLLSPAPGDQHGFGLAMVGFHLRRAGWDVRADVASDPDAVVALLGSRDYTVAGLSVGHDRAVAPAAALIARIRRRSRNRDIRIVVGGPMIVGHPELAREIGADFWAEDATTLVARMERMTPSVQA